MEDNVNKLMVRAAISEREVTAELYHPRRSIGTGNFPEAGILRRAAGRIWVGIVRSIRQVEGIHLETCRHLLVNLYRFRQ